MHSQQNPVINNWYTNLTGKLFKVKMASYVGVAAGVNVDSLVIEYIDGSKHVISKQEWDCLKLVSHNEKQSKQARGLKPETAKTEAIKTDGFNEYAVEETVVKNKKSAAKKGLSIVVQDEDFVF